MGDRRYAAPYHRVRTSDDKAAAIERLSDDEVVQALATAGRSDDPYVANVLATEAMNRMRRTRALMQHLAEGAFAVDRELRLTFVNPAIARVLGGEWPDYVGRHLPDVVQMVDAQGASVAGGPSCPVARALRSGETVEWSGHVGGVGREGRRSVVLAAPIRQNGEIEGAIVAVREAGPQVAREPQPHAIESEHARLLAVLAQAAVGITIAEAPSGRILLRNDEAGRIVGEPLAQSDVIADYAQYHAVHPDGTRYAAQEYPTARALRGETLRDEEVLYRAADGNLVRLSVNAAPVRDASGRIIAAITTFVNVDERRRAERQASEVATLMRSVVTSLHEGILVFDGFGRLQFANDSASRILGVPVEAYAKDSSPSAPSITFRDEAGNVLDPFETPAARALATREAVFDARLQVDHPRLGRRSLSVTALPMQGHGVVASFHDVTEERAARDALEARVKERTHDLEEALRDLETFTNSASHDLRAPLRGVTNLARELQEAVREKDVGSTEAIAARIEEEGERASRLVNDLLSFARSRRQPLHPEVVDVSALAQEIVDAIRLRHPTRTTTWEIQPGMRAYADPGLLRIALDNLLSNAAKYSSRAPDPHVSISASEEPGGTTLRIRDNGIGFPPEEYPRLFLPFQRLSTAQGYEGTGLGLATVHRIVTRHGGEIAATSAPGRGASFLVRLPPASAPS